MMSNEWSYYQDLQYNMLLTLSVKNSSLTEWSKPHLADALNNLGYLISFQDTEKALAYFLESAKIQTEINDLKGLSATYANIGFIYNVNGKIKEALDYQYKSIKLKEELSDEEGMAVSYDNIGSVYKSIGDDDLALKYYKKAQKIRETLKDNQEALTRSYVKIADIHSERGEKKKALALLKKALEIQKSIGKKLGVAGTLTDLGTIYLSLGKKELALSSFEESLSLSKKIDFKFGVAESYYGLSEIEFQNGELEKSIDFAEKSFNLFKELNVVRDVSKSAKLLSKIHEQQNSFSDALHFYKLHTSIKDSLKNEENQRKAIGIEYNYEYEKQKSIDKQKRERELYVLITAFVLLLIAIGVFLRFNYLKNSRNQEKLLHEIELLKEKGIARQIINGDNSADVLMRDKIEASFKGSFNYTDWKILNTIFNDPLISNKEIADQVSLSVEGVSSSLRKMYRLAEIKNVKNKKLALTIEVARISAN